MKRLAPFLLLAFLAACKQGTDKQNATNVNPAAYDAGSGNKVIFLCDYYTDYLNSIRGGAKNIDTLYKNKIQYPIYNNYFSHCEYAQLVGYQFYNTLKDTTGLALRIAAINSNRDVIVKMISSTLANCNKYLKNDSLTIYIQPSEAGFFGKVIKRMRGIAGFTAGSKSILITIDPGVTAWSDVLPHSLSHEYHHAYWTEMDFSKNPSWDILLDLVFEGRADAFSNIVYPGIVSPWDTALTDKQKADLWNRLKPILHNTDGSLYTKVMFGDYMDKADYPVWGGYCLGYNIVQSAMKNNPNITIEQWTNMEPEDLLKLSDYKLN